MQKFKVENYELDEHQMKLLSNDTNALVIAGAGSGKTLTILGKINYLIEKNICDSTEILVISFTNASVNDIKSRLNHNVDVFTFHKLAISILEKKQYNYSLCSSTLLEYITGELLKTSNHKDQKIILKFLNTNKSYNKFLNSYEFNSFCNLITTFINLYKTNNIDTQKFLNIRYTKSEKKILTIIFKIYNSYISEKNSANALDFDDLIIYATNFVKEVKLNYKYIIIDEFQDTSLIRLNLIKEIYKYTNAKIIAVGDDFQSIYHFSGCDLNIFLNFNKIFPNVKEVKLVNTYRNSLQLINIASTFIEKNPLQIKKKLLSSKSNDNPIIFSPYTNKNKTLKKLLNYLITITNNIIILSRNNKDIYEYIDKDYIFNNNILIYKNLEIKFYTIHKSKGLEAEYVIVLNCNNDYLGFPNKIENNQIIKKMLPTNEIKYAEERRLFYVAITRCKEATYLLYNKNNPSIFIKEIKRIIKHKLHNIKYFK